jgi:hypothetical protein
MDHLLKNWKSGAAGVAIVALAIGFLMGRIDVQTFLGAFALLTGSGLVAARDAGK